MFQPGDNVVKSSIDLAEDALVTLSQRINHNEDPYWGDLSATGIWTCLICKYTINVFPYITGYSPARMVELMEAIKNHGLNHLKEHNMLVFI